MKTKYKWVQFTDDFYPKGENVVSQLISCYNGEEFVEQQIFCKHEIWKPLWKKTTSGEIIGSQEEINLVNQELKRLNDENND